MAVQDPRTAALLEKARRAYKSFPVGDDELNFARLTLEDNVAIKEETGWDLFAESLSAGEGGEARLRLPPDVQLAVLYRSLHRCYPSITKDEVSDISALLSLRDILRIVVWALTGEEPPEEELGGKAKPDRRPGGEESRSSGGTSGPP